MNINEHSHVTSQTVSCKFVTATAMRACLLFLHAFSVGLQHKMYHRWAKSPPVVNLMLQTNQKKNAEKVNKCIIILCIVSKPTVGS